MCCDQDYYWPSCPATQHTVAGLVSGSLSYALHAPSITESAYFVSKDGCIIQSVLRSGRITLACLHKVHAQTALLLACSFLFIQVGDEGTDESHDAAATARDCLAPQQLTQLLQLTDIKTSAAEHAKSVKDAIKFEFLNTAAAGATAKLQLLLESGADVNMVDFGGRTALMLAAFSGHTVWNVQPDWSRQSSARDKFGWKIHSPSIPILASGLVLSLGVMCRMATRAVGRVSAMQ